MFLPDTNDLKDVGNELFDYIENIMQGNRLKKFVQLYRSVPSRHEWPKGCRKGMT